MDKLKSVDEILSSLGVNPAEKATIAFAMWKPWDSVSDAEHQDDPQGFVGTYGGYKVAESAKVGKSSVFDVFTFSNCNPAPSGGETGWAVTSGYQLEELKKVEPGTLIAVVYRGSEKNPHGGNTHNIEWYFTNPKDRTSRASATALPPSNAAALQAEGRKTLPANGIPF